MTTVGAEPATLRDVRGLRTPEGRIVRRGVLYRGDVPPAGGVGVAIWPPATVIDLRSAPEQLGEHPLARVAAVHGVPLGGDVAAGIARIVSLVTCAPAPVLVHGTTGRAGTGIVVAVLLRAVGVRRADILRTEAAAPEEVLDEVEAAPGGIAGWLAAHGVGPADLTRLADRLLSGVYTR